MFHKMIIKMVLPFILTKGDEADRESSSPFTRIELGAVELKSDSSAVADDELVVLLVVIVVVIALDPPVLVSVPPDR